MYSDRNEEVDNVKLDIQRSEDGKYSLKLIFEPLEASEIVDLYNENFLSDYIPETRNGVYGNSEEAISYVLNEETFGAAEFIPGSNTGNWALDVERVLEKYVDNDLETAHEDAVKQISTAVLATVSHALEEGLANEGMNFYSNFLEGAYGEPLVEPVEIDIYDMAEDEDYEELVSGTVEQAKKELQGLESPDWDAVLEAEQTGKNRVTLKRFIRERMEDR